MAHTADDLHRLVRSEQAYIDAAMQEAARYTPGADDALIFAALARALAAARRQEAHRADLGRRFPGRVAA